MKKTAHKETFNPDYSRREFIKATTLTVGAAAALSVNGYAPAQAAAKARGLPLSMAGYNFDRTRVLIDGSVSGLFAIQTESL